MLPTTRLALLPLLLAALGAQTPARPAPAAAGARTGQLPDALFLGASFPAPRIGIVVGGNRETDPAVVMCTEDDGSTWTAASLPEATVRLYDVQFPTPQCGFACGLQGLLLRTADGGRTWTRVPVPFARAWLTAVHFVDAEHGWLTGSQDGPLLAGTHDGGKTWERMAIPGPASDGDLRDLHFVDRRLGVACGSNGLLLRTADGGATWQTVASGSKAWLRHISFADADHGFVIAGDGALLATTDGGKQWRTRGNVPGKGNGVAFADAQRGLVVTMNGALWRTADGGASFVLQQQAEHALTVVIPRGDQGWLVFGEGVPPIRLPAGIFAR